MFVYSSSPWKRKEKRRAREFSIWKQCVYTFRDPFGFLSSIDRLIDWFHCWLLQTWTQLFRIQDEHFDEKTSWKGHRTQFVSRPTVQGKDCCDFFFKIHLTNFGSIILFTVDWSIDWLALILQGTRDDQDRILLNSCTLYVGNLSFYTSEEQIYELFSKCGDITRVIVGLDRVKKTACGFCFVEWVGISSFFQVFFRLSMFWSLICFSSSDSQIAKTLETPCDMWTQLDWTIDKFVRIGTPDSKKGVSTAAARVEVKWETNIESDSMKDEEVTERLWTANSVSKIEFIFRHL